MKRLISFVILLAMSLGILAFAGRPVEKNLHWSERKIEKREFDEPGTSAPEGMVQLKDLPNYYDRQQASIDGCYDALNDWDKIEEFVDSTSAGIPGMIRIFSGSSAEAQVSHVYDIEFDGEKYTLKQYMRDPETGLEYETLKTCKRLTESDLYVGEDNVDGLYSAYNDDVEAAAADGCIVVDSELGISYFAVTFKDVLYGEELWNEFYEKVSNGIPAIARICVRMQVVDEENRKVTDETYLQVSQLEYDGVYFYLTTYSENDGTEICSRWPALVKGEQTVGERTIEVFMLTMSYEYTYETVSDRTMRSTTSSYSKDHWFYIPDATVFAREIK